MIKQSELPYDMLLQNAEELEEKAEEYPQILIHLKAAANYLRMCAVIQRLNIPTNHPKIESAEKKYHEAMNKKPTQPAINKTMNIMDATSQLEEVILEND